MTKAAKQIQVGGTIGGKFSVIRVLGEGAQGVVYEAENQWTGRKVAIKVLQQSVAHDQEAVNRLTQEARVSTRIAHPNIVEVLDVGRDADGTVFMVTELLDGLSLRSVLARDKKLLLTDTTAIIVPVMSALLSAHIAGIIHRDVKPENIFLSKSRSHGMIVKLMDFGISKVLNSEEGGFKTRVGTIIGTPEYMSPEQVRGDEIVDHKCDIWSVGVVMYECLSGVMPFAGNNVNHVIVKVATETPPLLETHAPHIPRGVAAVVRNAMNPDRGLRFGSMRNFLEALLECPDVHYEAKGGTSNLLHNLVQPPSVAEGKRPSGSAEIRDREQDLQPNSQIPPPPSSLPVPVGPPIVDIDEWEVTNISHSKPTSAIAYDTLQSAKQCNWEGKTTEAEKLALSAMELFESGSENWYDALGEVAQASGRSGHFERLSALKSLLEERSQQVTPNAFHFIAAYRLAIELVFAGWADLADSMIKTLVENNKSSKGTSRSLKAWSTRYKAIRANASGNLGEYVSLMDESFKYFTDMGEERRATIQRLNVADGLLLLGQFTQGVAILREILRSGVLNNSVPGTYALLTLGFGLHRLQQNKDAQAVLFKLLQSGEFGALRIRAHLLVTIARVLMAQEKFEEAEPYALAATDLEYRSPPMRAIAFATLGFIRIAMGKKQLALEAAQQGLDLLETMHNQAEVSESFIRLSYALALEANGRLGMACKAMATAREHLVSQAEAIKNESWKESFLNQVEENQRVLSLAKMWLGG